MAELITGDPLFDRRFTVHTDDPRWALALLGSGLGRFLLASPDRSWRIDGRVILAWHRGRIDPAALDADFQHLLAVAGQAAAVLAG